jgi:hypothetical protein
MPRRWPSYPSLVWSYGISKTIIRLSVSVNLHGLNLFSRLFDYICHWAVVPWEITSLVGAIDMSIIVLTICEQPHRSRYSPACRCTSFYWREGSVPLYRLWRSRERHRGERQFALNLSVWVIASTRKEGIREPWPAAEVAELLLTVLAVSSINFWESEWVCEGMISSFRYRLPRKSSAIRHTFMVNSQRHST